MEKEFNALGMLGRPRQRFYSGPYSTGAGFPCGARTESGRHREPGEAMGVQRVADIDALECVFSFSAPISFLYIRSVRLTVKMHYCYEKKAGQVDKTSSG